MSGWDETRRYAAACGCTHRNGPCYEIRDEQARRIYNQMPDPKAVVAVGNCGASGDVANLYLDGPIDRIIPVDVYVHGCPLVRRRS